MTPTPEQWEQRFDDMWMTEEDGNSAVHTDKIRQFISQELKLQSSQLLSEVEVGEDRNQGKDEAWCEWFSCPKCEDTMITRGSKYCPNCGSKIKWKPIIPTS